MSSSPMLIAKTAKGSADISLLPRMANRHGLIAGATGTGKTVTLRVMAERFSSLGVPVFMADVKGDLSGLCSPGGQGKSQERATALALADYKPEPYPVVFWDVFGERGHPVRTTVSEMGPLLLSRLLELNETQAGVLNIVFKAADEAGLLLLDLKDLRSMLQFAADNAAEFKTKYGNISAASVGAVQRGLLTLEEQGGAKFFGEPALDIQDFLQTDRGKGVINILASDKLMQSPKLYGSLLFWMLSELYEQLPEVGDLEKPKFVLFFDEAHLLFEDIPEALEEKIEQVVRLIRSKGVGVYFVTQNPLDIPVNVLGQLGNRVQHALRAFTPKDQKAVRTAAETFRPNPAMDTATVIMELGVGEALVSTLDDKGTPTMVERAMICPPASRLEPLSAEELGAAIKGSVLYGHYEKVIDRESAYEQLMERQKVEQASELAEKEAEQERKAKAAESKSSGQSLFGAFAKSAVRAVGSQVGRQIVRGVLGSIFGGTTRRRRS